MQQILKYQKKQKTELKCNYKLYEKRAVDGYFQQLFSYNRIYKNIYLYKMIKILLTIFCSMCYNNTIKITFL